MKPDLLWPDARLTEAMAAVVAAAAVTGSPPPDGPVPRRLDLAAAALGVDVQPTPPGRERLDRVLRAAAPVLVPAGGGQVLAVVSAGRRQARVVAPGGGIATVPVDDIVALVDADDPALRWWVVRLSPGGSVRRQARQAGLLIRVAALVGAHAAQYGLFVGSWAVLGAAAFDGRLDGGALLTWALLLAATVPARVVATLLQAQVAVSAGWLLRRRLLHGTLRLRPDETRREGAGQMLGRSLEAEAVEDLAIGGGLLGVLATVEVLMAVAVLATGPGVLLSVLLVGWVGLTVVAARRYVRRRRTWAKARLGLTHDLIEKMVGHRTRLVQQPPERWHEGEDEALAGYAGRGRAMDRWLSALLAAVPRGWMVVAVAGLGIEVARGASAESVAIAAGGILLALSALTRLVNGLAQMADAAVAWTQVAPLFDAAARTPPAGSRGGTPAGPSAVADPVVEADELEYRYEGRSAPALDDCSLRIRSGDRVLLEGPSGSGKSTLAALLSGLRVPTGGRLRLSGVEQEAMGVAAWRRRVVASPQFHENHVVLGPLAFNLLLGRAWPPAPDDLRAAYELCLELGLGPLLDRMPSGLQQMVGDTGWQLSHGERSLVFLARALLQGADLVLLDETFGALDPVTMRRAVEVTLARTETLVVIRQ